MQLLEKILDLNLRKILRRTRAVLGMGDPWATPLKDIADLLGSEESIRIAAMPRFTRGETKLNNFNVVFNDAHAFLGVLDEIYLKCNYAFTVDTKNPLFLDCGANIGIAVLYLKQHYPDAEIHAFEPDEDAFLCLSQNVKNNNLSNVFLYKKAIWVKEENLEFFSDGSWGGGIYSKEGTRKTIVSAVDISDFLNRKIDFLKMDIEGAESSVINHAIEKITRNVDRFFFEWHSFKESPQELGSILKKFEFANFRYHIKEASIRDAPFEKTPLGVMDSQLDVFLYRNIS